jgi:hypothetical protein
MATSQSLLSKKASLLSLNLALDYKDIRVIFLILTLIKELLDFYPIDDLLFFRIIG